MDENQVCQAGQGIFGITDLLLQEARNLFLLKQRVEHQTWERLSDSTQNVLQNHTEPQVHSSNTTPCCKHAGFTNPYQNLCSKSPEWRQRQRVWIPDLYVQQRVAEGLHAATETQTLNHTGF